MEKDTSVNWIIEDRKESDVINSNRNSKKFGYLGICKHERNENKSNSHHNIFMNKDDADECLENDNEIIHDDEEICDTKESKINDSCVHSHVLYQNYFEPFETKGKDIASGNSDEQISRLDGQGNEFSISSKESSFHHTSKKEIVRQVHQNVFQENKNTLITSIDDKHQTSYMLSNKNCQNNYYSSYENGNTDKNTSEEQRNRREEEKKKDTRILCRDIYNDVRAFRHDIRKNKNGWIKHSSDCNNLHTHTIPCEPNAKKEWLIDNISHSDELHLYNTKNDHNKGKDEYFNRSNYKNIIKGGKEIVLDEKILNRQQRYSCEYVDDTHVSTHACGCMNQFQLDRALAIENHRLERVRDAYGVVVTLTKKYGLKKVLNDVEMRLIMYKYFQMRQFMAFFDGDLNGFKTSRTEKSDQKRAENLHSKLTRTISSLKYSLTAEKISKKQKISRSFSKKKPSVGEFDTHTGRQKHLKRSSEQRSGRISKNKKSSLSIFNSFSSSVKKEDSLSENGMGSFCEKKGNSKDITDDNIHENDFYHNDNQSEDGYDNSNDSDETSNDDICDDNFSDASADQYCFCVGSKCICNDVFLCKQGDCENDIDTCDNRQRCNYEDGRRNDNTDESNIEKKRRKNHYNPWYHFHIDLQQQDYSDDSYYDGKISNCATPRRTSEDHDCKEDHRFHEPIICANTPNSNKKDGSLGFIREDVDDHEKACHCPFSCVSRSCHHHHLLNRHTYLRDLSVIPFVSKHRKVSALQSSSSFTPSPSFVMSSPSSPHVHMKSCHCTVHNLSPSSFLGVVSSPKVSLSHLSKKWTFQKRTGSMSKEYPISSHIPFCCYDERCFYAYVFHNSINTKNFKEILKNNDILFGQKETTWINSVDESTLKISHRRHTNNTKLNFLICAKICCPMDHLVCIFNELDLFTAWIPSFTFPVRLGLREAKNLARFGRIDQLSLFNIDFPWPLNDRDACVFVWGADDFEHSNRFFVRIQHCDNKRTVFTGEYTPPEPDEKTMRIFCDGAMCVSLESESCISLKFFWTVDLGIHVSDFLLNFFSKVFAKSAFQAFRKVCTESFNREEEHIYRKKANPFLYVFVRSRIQELAANNCFAYQKNIDTEEQCKEYNRNEKGQKDKIHQARDQDSSPQNKNIASFNLFGKKKKVVIRNG